MKTFGSVLNFTRQRNAALLEAYRYHIDKVDCIRLNEIGEKIVNSPSPRFWVSVERAAAVVSAMLRGKPVLQPMRQSKREMFEEIYRRFIALKERHPDWYLYELVAEVVHSPAPKFYMEPSSALERLFKIRNGWYDKNNDKSIRGC